MWVNLLFGFSRLTDRVILAIIKLYFLPGLPLLWYFFEKLWCHGVALIFLMAHTVLSCLIFKSQVLDTRALYSCQVQDVIVILGDILPQEAGLFKASLSVRSQIIWHVKVKLDLGENENQSMISSYHEIRSLNSITSVSSNPATREVSACALKSRVVIKFMNHYWHSPQA